MSLELTSAAVLACTHVCLADDEREHLSAVLSRYTLAEVQRMDRSHLENLPDASPTVRWILFVFKSHPAVDPHGEFKSHLRYAPRHVFDRHPGLWNYPHPLPSCFNRRHVDEHDRGVVLALADGLVTHWYGGLQPERIPWWFRQRVCKRVARQMNRLVNVLLSSKRPLCGHFRGLAESPDEDAVTRFVVETIRAESNHRRYHLDACLHELFNDMVDADLFRLVLGSNRSYPSAREHPLAPPQKRKTATSATTSACRPT